MIVRGCGVRQAGGIYLEVATSPFGMPLEHFLIDSPLRITPSAMGLTPVGVRGFTDGEGVYQILDWVGSDSYPKLADFIDEAHVGGISRRCEGAGVDYSKITRESRLLLVHSRAAITNWQGMMHAISLEHNAWRCSKSNCPCGVCHETYTRHVDQFEACKTLEFQTNTVIETSHETAVLLNNASGCISLHWHDFEPKDLVALTNTLTVSTSGERERPYGRYYARTRPELNGKPYPTNYDIAVFARLPIGGIAVVRDPDANWRSDAQVAKARKAFVPVELVDE